MQPIKQRASHMWLKVEGPKDKIGVDPPDFSRVGDKEPRYLSGKGIKKVA